MGLTFRSTRLLTSACCWRGVSAMGSLFEGMRDVNVPRIRVSPPGRATTGSFPPWRAFALSTAATLLFSGCAVRPQNTSPAPTPCVPPLSPFLRNALYFGLSSPLVPGRVITPEIWATFSREVLSEHFRSGMTVLDSYGAWRRQDGSYFGEPSKVVIVLYSIEERGAATQAPQSVIAEAKRRFGYRSVLWEQSLTCASF
jgi:uncharacterized protein DUF3574